MRPEWRIASGVWSTVVIAVANLFIIFVLPWRRRPKFFVDYQPVEPFCRQTLSAPPTLSPTYWVRLRVRNSGRVLARGCLCKLIEVVDVDGDPVQEMDPMQLHWVGTDWQAVPLQTIDLDRDDYAYVDVLATRPGETDVLLAGDQFPGTGYQARGIRNSLPPGRYVLRISVYGEDVRPATKYLSLVWAGESFTEVAVDLHDQLQRGFSYQRRQ